MTCTRAIERNIHQHSLSELIPRQSSRSLFSLHTGSRAIHTHGRGFPAHVLLLVPLDGTASLLGRGGTARQALVEVDDASHARTVGSAADGLNSSFSSVPMSSCIVLHFVKMAFACLRVEIGRAGIC